MAPWHWLQSQPRFRDLTRGQGLVEYALLIIFVAVVLVALLTVLGPGLQEIYENIIESL
ncbi:MAG: pilus assembly protein [Chloroflexi bacterium]|nr:pilus assembly protein [Chloroflexota bacterium]